MWYNIFTKPFFIYNKGGKQMTDNELLLAMSEMLDKKLRAELEPIKKEISEMKVDQTRINIIIENEIRSDVKLLAENYVPAARRYEDAAVKLDSMKSDIELLKKVVTEHSAKIQKIS